MSQNSELQKELRLLQNFASTSLRNGSIVYCQVQKIIEQMSASIVIPPKRESDLAIRIRLNNHGRVSTHDITIPVESTLEQLKSAIEAVDKTGSVVDRIMNRRTGKAWGQFNSKPVVSCEIQNGDELTIDCRRPVETRTFENPTGLERIEASNIRPHSAFESIVLALHAFLLDEGFVFVVELPNNTPGFAPSLKELPKDIFLPNNWNVDLTSTSMMYKHKAKPGKYFKLSCTVATENVLATFSMRGGDCNTIELSLRDHIDTDAISTVCVRQQNIQPSSGTGEMLLSIYKNIDALKAVAQQLAYKLLPAVAMPIEPPVHASSVSSSTTSAGNDKQQQQSVEESQYYRSHVPMDDEPTATAPNVKNYSTVYPPTVTSVGRSDVDPFPGIGVGPLLGGNGGIGIGGTMPIPRGDESTYPSSGNNGGGNLMGPDHPIFQPTYNNDYNDNDHQHPPPPFLPDARFDPFGPVLGPNSFTGGEDVGNVGVDSRGRRLRDPPVLPGRGGGGRGSSRLYPGEPNPDHLKPPGW